MRYFQLVMSNENRWTLSIERKFQDGRDIDIWAYSRGTHAPDDPVPYYVLIDGDVVDFNPTAFGSIVVSSSMADILCRYAKTELQRIPAVISGAKGEWEVINITSIIDCIDYQRSSITYFPPDHPEKGCMPRGITRLVIDSNKTKGVNFFRPLNWTVATIVSEVLKNALLASNVTGVEYWAVTETNDL